QNHQRSTHKHQFNCLRPCFGQLSEAFKCLNDFSFRKGSHWF
ncbi:MAG: hypothetical protein HW378_4737, partial [Anaerolineales bacterium]|nr:hypothetical protein [Anaerolineales bacterium]